MDVDPGTLNLDAELVRRRIVSDRPAKLQAILPVHLYGQCADMDAFTEIGQEFGVAIVEDAAQAIAAEWRRRGAGSLEVTAAFSFYPTKNLSAYGDAGIVTTMDWAWPSACGNSAIMGVRDGIITMSLDGTDGWMRFRQRCCA